MVLETMETTLGAPAHRKPGRQRPIPTLTVIAHPDTSRIGDCCPMLPMMMGNQVALSRKELVFKKPDQTTARTLEDPFLSRSPITFRFSPSGGVVIDASASRTGLRLGSEPVSDQVEVSAMEMERGAVLVLVDRIVLLLHWTRRNAPIPAQRYGLVGFSDALLFLCDEIKRVADLDTPVLLRGASGTGKELVSRAIHDFGHPGTPFISVNMGAIPPNLAASELFGAVKGSFTGADRNQVGYFKAARGGTLFLDEIGEATPEVQVMLLRALESGEICPVGSQTPIKVKTRLVAATDADLENKMQEDTFKTPLFHRLAGYEIRLPPLAARREDMGRLFMHFARQELAEIGESVILQHSDPRADAWLDPDLVIRLLEFPWPGNVRQLRNVVRQLIIGCRGETVLHSVPRVEELLACDEITLQPEPPAPAVPSPGKRKPADISSEELTRVLEENRWDIKYAAQSLGISRGAVYLMIEKTPGLIKAGDLTAEDIRTAMKQHGQDTAKAAYALKVSVRALGRRMKEVDL